MLNFQIKKDPSGKRYLETTIDGKALLSIPQLNKGTAFTEEERIAFSLIGKLPPRTETLGEQVSRAYAQYSSYQTRLNKNVYLNNLLNTNQVLFFALIKTHLKEMLPTIYTPIVGRAVKNYSEKFSKPRGLYISYQDQDRIEEILKNRSNPEVRLIVVSDGEGVLGIGDQGVGGCEIPIAKLMVYSALGGIDPLHTLPILLDAGTNNKKLLEDPFYLGWRHKRIQGQKYDAFIAKFIDAVKKIFPHIYLHWEDFGRHNAKRNLITYRRQICSFNDDIQGTGVVAVASLLAALRRTKSQITDQRIVIFGAGTAGTGVTEALCQAMQRAGLSEAKAQKQFWLIDQQGLLIQGTAGTTDAQENYLRDPHSTENWKKEGGIISLETTIQEVKPTVLIGCSGVGGAFDEAAIKAMCEHTTHPIIFPLSNPTERAEATPEQLFEWTNGQAVIATGSPFPDVTHQNKIHPISQCNNYLAFPGIGLGVITIGASRVTKNMLAAASHALSTFTKDSEERLLPDVNDAQEASRAIAIAVAEAAVVDGVATRAPKTSIAEWINNHYWEPAYLPYRLPQ